MNIGDTTPVGRYSPQSDSSYGVADMAGNVWEWTHTLFVDYPYRSNDGRESEETSGLRVLRGGSFRNGREIGRCAYRNGLDPENRYDSIGFRVVASPIHL
jgi:formylglycine-generating enzyme required for sulfatase activity